MRQVLIEEKHLVLHYYCAPPELSAVAAASLHPAVEVYEDACRSDLGATACGRGLRCRSRSPSRSGGRSGSGLPAGCALYEEEPLVVTPTGVRATHRARWRAYLWLVACGGEGGEDAASLAAFDALTMGEDCGGGGNLGLAPPSPTSPPASASSTAASSTAGAATKAAVLAPGSGPASSSQGAEFVAGVRMEALAIVDEALGQAAKDGGRVEGSIYGRVDPKVKVR
jgi:hypothetical protein